MESHLGRAIHLSLNGTANHVQVGHPAENVVHTIAMDILDPAVLQQWNQWGNGVVEAAVAV